MMQENTEDNMFNALLSDYAAPLDDDGFSDALMANLPTRQTHPLKAKFISTAAILGGAYAALQLPTLWRYISGLTLPSFNVPKLDVSQIETAATSSSYTLVAAALFAIMIIWLGSTFVFGDEM